MTLAPVWDAFARREPGDKSNLLDLALDLARGGINVVFISPVDKTPMDLRTVEQRSADDAQARDTAKDKGNPKWDQVRSPAGVHLGTTDPARLTSYLATYAIRYPDMPPPNLGIALRGRSLAIVDCDHAESVAAFRDAYRRTTGENIEPTVLSPGKQDGNGNWVHRDGGHFYFALPDGLQLPKGTTDLTHDPREDLSVGGQPSKHAWTLMVQDKYVLCPPSTRAEGPYRWMGGDITPLPEPILAWAVNHAQERAANIAERAERISAGSAGDIDAWAADVPWSELLIEDGWEETPSADNCGCPIFTAPGSHSSPKSATAHDLGCTRGGTEYGHGPLHIWTDAPPPELGAYVSATGSKTLTKLQYVAWTEHGGDVAAACTSLNIADTRDDERVARMLLRNADGQPITVPMRPLLDVEDDADDATSEPEQMDEETAAPIGKYPVKWDYEKPSDTTMSAAEWAEVLHDLRENDGGWDDPNDPELFPKGYPAHPALVRAIMDYSDYTRAIFHAARHPDMHLVNPVGLLLMELIRAGRSAPVDLGPYSRTALSTYMVVIGDTGRGKGQTTDIANSPFKADPTRFTRPGGFLPPDLDHTDELGSGQVLVDLFMEEVSDENSDDPKAKTWRMKESPSVHLAVDEMASLLALAGSPTGVLLTNLTSAWSAKELGTSTRGGGTDRRTKGPYSLFITAGLQPEKSAPFFASADVGFEPRFIKVDAADVGAELCTPALAGEGAPVPTLPRLVIPDGVHTFTLCPEVREIQRRAKRKARKGGSTVDLGFEHDHSLKARVTLACLLALFHGTLDVDAKAWEWSGAVMEYSRRSSGYCKAAMERTSAEAAASAGSLKSVEDTARKATGDKIVQDAARAALSKLKAAGDEGMYISKLRASLLSTRKPRTGGPSRSEMYWDDVLKAILDGGNVKLDGKTMKYIEKWFPPNP